MNCEDVLTDAPLYIAGDLDGARQAEFQAHLEICPECAAELARQSSVDARVRETVLAETPDSRSLERGIRLSIRVRRWLPAVVGIAAALVLVMIGSLILTSIRASHVYTDAARDHRREVVDQQPRTWITDRSALETLAGQQGLLPTAVARLTRAGYGLERGKLCRLDGRVYLHMVYTRGGREFSMFLRQRGEPYPSRVRNSVRGEEHVASFQTDLVAGVVVTDQSSQAAAQLARFAAALL